MKLIEELERITCGLCNQTLPSKRHKKERHCQRTAARTQTRTRHNQVNHCKEMPASKIIITRTKEASCNRRIRDYIICNRQLQGWAPQWDSKERATMSSSTFPIFHTSLILPCRPLMRRTRCTLSGPSARQRWMSGWDHSTWRMQLAL